MKACNCTNKNWHLVCDSCGGNLPSCLDCTDTERQLKEARAEIERLKIEADKWRKESLAKDDARLNLQAASDSIKYWTKQSFDKDELIEQMRDVLNILVASAPPSGPLWHGSAEMQIARAALSAAERINK